MIIATDTHTSILRNSDVTKISSPVTPVLASTQNSYGIQEAYVTELNPLIHGYALVSSASSPILDEHRI